MRTRSRGKQSRDELTEPVRYVDVELKVEGIKTLYDSFRDYVAVGTLDSELKYQTEGLGLQDVQKSITFQSFPPVLHLLLKRFEYATQSDAMVKVCILTSSKGYLFGSEPPPPPEVDDRFEFPFEIDLDDFLDEKADRTGSWKYKLHGVVIHSGDLRTGEYFALIKPDRHTRWLKFEDERVTPVTDQEVLGEGYGGEPPGGVVLQTQGNQVKAVGKSANARMLVYIRDTAIDEVLAPLTQEDVPPHLCKLCWVGGHKILAHFPSRAG